MSLLFYGEVLWIFTLRPSDIATTFILVLDILSKMKLVHLKYKIFYIIVIVGGAITLQGALEKEKYNITNAIWKSEQFDSTLKNISDDRKFNK